MKNWQHSTIAPDSSILTALQTLNDSSLQVVLVLDAEGKLLGTVTDGDVRRAILRNVSLEGPVRSIMETEFIAASHTDTTETIQELMRSHELRHIPVLDESGRIVDLRVLLDMLSPTARPNWVVVMAGGKGMRLRPLTESCPKPMLCVGGRPVLESILEGLRKEGFRNIFLSVNYLGHVIENHFGDGSAFGLNIRYLKEEEPLGTAGPLTLLPQRPHDTFLVMNGDILNTINFQNLLAFHERSDTLATMCVRDLEMTVPYGVVEIENNYMTGLVEKPTHHFFVNAGVYAFAPKALDHLDGGPQDMPDLFQKLLDAGHPAATFPLHEYWLDIGRHSDLDLAKRNFRPEPEED